MFYFKTVISALIIINFQTSSTCPEGYYWREYTGKIPNDALVGGKDINNQNIYIGQAYVHNVGLIVAPIFPGVKEVKLHLAHNPYTIRYHIKILCGRQQDFHWETLNATNLHLFLLDKHAVIGGHVSEGYLNIGRINLEGETKIGRIHSYALKTPDLDFSHKGKETQVLLYEILLYEKFEIDERGDLRTY